MTKKVMTAAPNRKSGTGCLVFVILIGAGICSAIITTDLRDKDKWHAQHLLLAQPLREQVRFEAAGVTVQGYDSRGVITNHNDCQVRIKVVTTSVLSHGTNGNPDVVVASALEIKALEPGETWPIWVNPNFQFFILSKEGGEIGLIIPKDPYPYGQYWTDHGPRPKPLYPVL